ncbi:MAG: hypothetical protein U1F27_03140 [Turneriella sp.]
MDAKPKLKEALQKIEAMKSGGEKKRYTRFRMQVISSLILLKDNEVKKFCSRWRATTMKLCACARYTRSASSRYLTRELLEYKSKFDPSAKVQREAKGLSLLDGKECTRGAAARAVKTAQAIFIFFAAMTAAAATWRRVIRRSSLLCRGKLQGLHRHRQKPVLFLKFQTAGRLPRILRCGRLDSALRYRRDRWDYDNDTLRDSLRQGITYRVVVGQLAKVEEGKIPAGVSGAGLPPRACGEKYARFAISISATWQISTNRHCATCATDMLLLVLILLTFACAFFSGSEAAIFSQDLGRLRRTVIPSFSLKLKKTLIGWLKAA